MRTSKRPGIDSSTEQNAFAVKRLGERPRVWNREIRFWETDLGRCIVKKCVLIIKTKRSVSVEWLLSNTICTGQKILLDKSQNDIFVFYLFMNCASLIMKTDAYTRMCMFDEEIKKKKNWKIRLYKTSNSIFNWKLLRNKKKNKFWRICSQNDVPISVCLRAESTETLLLLSSTFFQFYPFAKMIRPVRHVWDPRDRPRSDRIWITCWPRFCPRG